MQYKLFNGFILGPGSNAGEVDIFFSKMAVDNGNVRHTLGSELEAELWLETQPSGMMATQADVDDLNFELNLKSIEPVPMAYGLGIMQTLRQKRGLEPNDTSQDAQIQDMGNDEAFRAMLEWEGIIGFDYKIRDWVKEIYGVVLRID